MIVSHGKFSVEMTSQLGLPGRRCDAMLVDGSWDPKSGSLAWKSFGSHGFFLGPKTFILHVVFVKKRAVKQQKLQKPKRPNFSGWSPGSRLGAGRGVECLCYWSADHLCQCLEAGLRWVVQLYDTERVKGSSFQDAASWPPRMDTTYVQN